MFNNPQICQSISLQQGNRKIDAYIYEYSIMYLIYAT
jgi:hypothetical protein